MDKKKLRNDIILIASLLLVAIVSLVFVFVFRTKDNLVAKVYLQNTIVETIDLSTKQDSDYYVDGLKGKVHIKTHDGGVAIVESNCPHQDCVNIGYVYETNRPIICAYNAVYVVIEGSNNDADVRVG